MPSRGPNALEPLDYEIADINFGKSDMKETDLLLKLGNLQA